MRAGRTAAARIDGFVVSVVESSIAKRPLSQFAFVLEAPIQSQETKDTKDGGAKRASQGGGKPTEGRYSG